MTVRLTDMTVGSYPRRMDSDQPRPTDSDLVVIDESTASVLEVWRSLTDEHTEWWPGMQFEAVRGAPLRETWAEDGVEYQAMGYVVEVQDGRVLTFDWSEPGWPTALRVRIELDQIASGSRVSVMENGFNRLSNGHAISAAHYEGWTYHLARLLGHAER